MNITSEQIESAAKKYPNAVTGPMAGCKHPAAARKLPTVEELLASPCVSYWLKDALKTALNRDRVDASHDAELLAAVLGERTKKALAE